MGFVTNRMNNFKLEFKSFTDNIYESLDSFFESHIYGAKDIINCKYLCLRAIEVTRSGEFNL